MIEDNDISSPSEPIAVDNRPSTISPPTKPLPVNKTKQVDVPAILEQSMPKSVSQPTRSMGGGIKSSHLLLRKQRSRQVKEATPFFRKKYTRIEKDDRPTRVGGCWPSSPKMCRRHCLPSILREDFPVSKAEKHLNFTSNGDDILIFASRHLIALHGVLNLSMRANDPKLAELIVFLQLQIHVRTQKFINKWFKKISGIFPTKRVPTFESVAHWWKDSANIDDVLRSTQSVSFHELMLLGTAPTMYNNDHWIQ